MNFELAKIDPQNCSIEELDHPIQDIWIIKKDREKERPWCKVIKHVTPNTNTAVVNFQDFDVQPNDFYWVAIRQKGEELKPGENNLEIPVINSWYNRVAGEEMNLLPEQLTSTNIILAHDFRGRPIDVIPLETSGLLGPVEILKDQNK